MSYQIKFGTDGWRAIIAKDYTTDNLKRVSQATALWVKKESTNHKIVIGFDCRFGGSLFLETASEVFAAEGLEVIYCPYFVSTPMISLAAKNHNAFAGIIITASHNPAAYSGFKIKAHYGGPAVPSEIKKVEDLIPSEYSASHKNFQEYVNEGKIIAADFEKEYEDHIRNNFDIEKINDHHNSFAYDAMYGAGQNIMRNLFTNVDFLHCDYNPSFDGTAPEPIHKNLLELSEMIKMSDGNIASGLATDGDADRIGLYDENGNFVDSHHIILLLINYLVTYKGLTGKVVTSFSCSGKIKKLCQQLGLEQITTKIGFKYICEYMVNDDILLGGEESGGIAIKGHIPERDGIWMGLTVWSYMLKENKTLTELIDDIYQKVGSFAFDRDDLHITQEEKNNAVEMCASGNITKIGNYSVENTETLDGYKFLLGNDRWVMIRPSGTEPVLRIYAEAENKEEVRKILDAANQTVLGNSASA